MQLKRLRKYIVLGLIMLSLTLVVVLVNYKVRFTVGDELVLKVAPLQQAIFLLNDEDHMIDFTLKADSFTSCYADCELIVRDLWNDEIVWSENVSFKNDLSYNRSVYVPAPNRGEAQRIFTFEAECSNRRGIRCPTDGESRIATAIVAINYELSDNEKSIISNYKQDAEDYFFSLRNLSDYHRYVSSSVQKVPSSSERFVLEGDLLRLARSIDSLKSQADEVYSAWLSEDFEEFGALFASAGQPQNLMVLLDGIDEGARDLRKARRDIAGIYATIDFSKVGSYAKFLKTEPSIKNNLRLGILETDVADLSDIHRTLNSPGHSEKEALRLLLNASMRLQSTLSDYDGLLARADEILDWSERVALLKGIETTRIEGCNGVRRYMVVFKDALVNISEDEVATDGLAQAALNSTINLSQINLSFENASINLSGLEYFVSQYCGDLAVSKVYTPNLDNLTYFEVDIFEEPELFVPPLAGGMLDPVVAICCTFGQCLECCQQGCSEQIPVIFIHGHAFNQENTPAYSMRIFGKMQRELSKQGYLDLGELYLLDDSGRVGVWGKSSRPVTVRASYYLISYVGVGAFEVSTQNAESMENYALRLREIIDVVRHKTGAKRVNVVAHSMGGLVARQYMDLFGSGSVDKLITINTPHHGISGKVRDFCAVLGAKKECDEMSQGSVFLTRLNSRPVPPNIISIRSTGCMMDDGSDGDGVVSSQSAVLEGAQNIEIVGSCTGFLGSDLHTNVLDIEKYPELFSTLLQLLGSTND